MTSINARRTAAAVAAAICIAIPAAAQADAAARTDAAQLPRAKSGSVGTALAQERYYSSYTTPDTAKSTFPSADYRGGDNPADHPGMSRAQPAPTTVEVVRPERTIVRDVNQVLPIALASTALLLVLAMLAGTLVRSRLALRPGRSS
jgi:hypothetical protein